VRLPAAHYHHAGGNETPGPPAVPIQLKAYAIRQAHATASCAMHDVMNQAGAHPACACGVSLARRSSVVGITLRAPARDNAKKWRSEIAKRFIPPPTRPGSCTALKGAYASAEIGDVGNDERRYQHRNSDEVVERNHIEAREGILPRRLDREKVIAERGEGGRGEHEENHQRACT